MTMGHGNPRRNECLLTGPAEAVGLLSSFEGGQFLTAVTSYDQGDYNCPIGLLAPMHSKALRLET